MTGPGPRPLSRRRRITVAGLLVGIAAIAFGLGGFRRAEPWLSLRVAHPGMATVGALFARSPESLRCAACHERPNPVEIVEIRPSPHCTPGVDCKGCHAR